MQKRLLGVLIGIALLTTLCMNVLAAYADPAPSERTTDNVVPLTEVATTEDSTDSSSTPDAFQQAYDTLAVDTMTEPSTPEETTGPSLIVNGVAVDNPGTAMMNDTTYISIRSIVLALDPNASVSWSNGQLLASGNGFQLSARPGDCYMVVNDRYLYVPDGILFQDDATMAPIRTICNALGASTQWEVMTGNITVNQSGSPLVSGSSYYNSNDLYWLSRIITAESRNQPLKGKIAVGTVIMNRVESPKFPDSIYDVIFSGIQFSPVQDGSIYRDPTTEAVIAAKLVLDGAREAGDSLFFNRNGLNSWASRNKTYITTIADHSFYR